MHILFATPEINPFSESKLASFAATISSTVRDYRPGWAADYYEKKGIDPAAISSPVNSVAVISPLYGEMDPDALLLAMRLTKLSVPWHGRDEVVHVYEGVTHERVPVFLLKHEFFGERAWVEGPASEDLDNAVRYAFFSKCVLEFCRTSSRAVDIVHCLSWASALIPTYLAVHYERDPKLLDLMTMLHLYDLKDQGCVSPAILNQIELTSNVIAREEVVLDRRANFVHSGVLFTDVILTNSPAFAKQIQHNKHGGPLAGTLLERSDDLIGIPLGIDFDGWDPSKDTNLPVNFDRERLNGKRRNKAELQHIFGLPIRPLEILVGLSGRFSEADGAVIVANAIEELLLDDLSLQFVVVGDGDFTSKKRFVELAERFPEAVGLHYEEDEALTHRLLAGCDLIIDPRALMAEHTQVVRGMRYGAIPMAHGSGANLDSVKMIGEAGDPLPSNRGVGFLFSSYDVDEIADCLDLALEVYRSKRQWRPIVDHCMKYDSSLNTMSHNLVLLYSNLLDI